MRPNRIARGFLNAQQAFAGRVGTGLGEFGAQKEDLRGVVDPQQQDNQAARHPVGRGNRSAADVPSDEV